MVIVGPTGCGKSGQIRHGFDLSEMWKPQGQWWDGYQNQRVVVFDEFYSWIPYSELLRLLDRYPLKVPIKGSYTEFNSEIIIFTSNIHWEEWYSNIENKQSLHRRMQIKIDMNFMNKEDYWKGPLKCPHVAHIIIFIHATETKSRRKDRVGGGLLIGIPEQLSARLIPCNLPQNSDLEILAIKVNTDALSFYIINIYAPTGFDIDIIRTFLDTLTEPSLIFGDFNLHHPLWGSNDSSRLGNKFSDWLTNSNFVILNTSTPTHTSPAAKQSLLDITLCSQSLLYHSDCFVVDSSFESGHSPVVTTCTLFQHKQIYLTEIKRQSIMIVAEKSLKRRAKILNQFRTKLHPLSLKIQGKSLCQINITHFGGIIFSISSII
ncbi:Replication-associated protein [Araneus ventricosus]|uniref:Replication-associated protein n=1 Tax=Araneus ventricosus TaxID=182803 RepID=A0A4Y2M6M0_ARAVE|nr:Replication-associated protein [Araneus ventricosus]